MQELYLSLMRLKFGGELLAEGRTDALVEIIVRVVLPRSFLVLICGQEDFPGLRRGDLSFFELRLDYDISHRSPDRHRKSRVERRWALREPGTEEFLEVGFETANALIKVANG